MLHLRLVFIGLLLHALRLVSCLNKCKGQPVFVAEELSAVQKAEYKYYYTAKNTSSLLCCAHFCAQTTFCRTAVYDYHAKTCGIVYASGVRCHNGPRLEDTASTLQRDIPLTAIHCPVCTGFGKDLEEECSREPKPRATKRVTTKKAETTSRPATASPEVTTTVETPTAPPSETPPTTTTQESFTETTTEAVTTENPKEIPESNSTERPEGADFPLESLLGVARTGLQECFPQYSQKALVAVNPQQAAAATFIVEKGLSLDECKCACASSWHSRRYSKTCRSIQYFPQRQECFINNVDHTSTGGTHRLTPLQSDTGSYYNFPCYRTELETTQYLLQNCRGLVPAPGKTDGIAFGSGGLNSNPYFLNDPASLLNPCFEIVSGYTLAAQAIEIRRGLSMQECMCVCAGNEDFRCRSSLYKERTRECTLNLENRVNLPHLFSKVVSEDRVLYLGYTCNADKGKKYIESYCRGAPSLPGRGSPASPLNNDESEKGLEISRAGPGPNSDRCFVEIPQYSLQGKATAVKYGQSLESCKCHCLFSREIFDFECKSIQYYFESKSCILNTHDRLNTPVRFVQIKGYIHHSYFDFNCTVTRSSSEKYDWRNEFLSQVYGEDVCKSIDDFDYRSVLLRRYAKKERRDAWILLGEKGKKSRESGNDVPSGQERQRQWAVNGKDVYDLFKYGEKQGPNNGTGTSYRTRVVVSKPGERIRNHQITVVSIIPDPGQNDSGAENEWKRRISLAGEPSLNGRITGPFNDGADSGRSNLKIGSVRLNPRILTGTHTKYTENFKISNSNPSTEISKGPPSNPSNQGKRINSGNRIGVEVDIHESSTSPVPTTKQPVTSGPIAVVTTTQPPTTTSPTPKPTTTQRPTTTSPTPKPTTTTKKTTPSTTTLKPTTQKPTTKKPVVTTTKAPTTTTLKGSVPISEGDIKGVGECSYSTFYQMEFKGSKLLDRIIVTDAISCIHKCAITEKCQSANFRKFTGTYRYCEIFADIPLQYAFHDLQVEYNMASAHFAGIKCEKKNVV